MEIKIISPKYGEKVVLIDDEDYALISKYTWSVNYVRGKWYALAYAGQKKGKVITVKMHRLIMDVLKTPKIHIDHKDQNGLNNQKVNLRKATIAENSRNVGPNKRSTTGFKGVSLYTKNTMAGWYVVRVRYYDKNIFGGYFKDPVEAAKKYNEMAIKYHGEFAYQNPIPESI